MPRNLELLHAAFDPKRIGDILPGDTFTLDGVEFVCAYLPESTAERFFIVKTRALVDRYIALCEEVRGGRIVELGIAEGGSTALIAMVADPALLVAVDLETEPLDALDEFLAARGLLERVRPVYGMDQSDRVGLAAVVDEARAGEPLDLVIDDCSHLLDATRSSFETLFPRLRPGGRFVIEDWNAEHLMREAVAAALRAQLETGSQELRDEIRGAIAAAAAGGEVAQAAGIPEERRPLSQLAIEAVLARAGSGDAIAEVTVDEYWVTITRGPGELDPTTWRLDDAYTDFFGLRGW